MSPTTTFGFVLRVVSLLDEVHIPYVLGGSLAASVFGEPRATADADIAVELDRQGLETFIGRLGPSWYVPGTSARQAVDDRTSFNLLDTESTMKVDLFVLGDGLLDRHQLQRRVAVRLEGADGPVIWVTSPEDQVLRKLDWFRTGGEVSDRQWRDVLGLLRAQDGRLDEDYLHVTADACGLRSLLDRAVAAAAEWA